MFTTVLFLSGIAVRVCTNMREKNISSHAYVYEPRSDKTGENENIVMYGYSYTILPENSYGQNGGDNFFHKDLQVFTAREKLLCHLFEILTVILSFLILCAGICITDSVFYSRRLKEPFFWKIIQRFGT